MAIIAKVAEVASKFVEVGDKKIEPTKYSGKSELDKKDVELENIRKTEIPEISKEGRLPIDIIKDLPLQQLVEENKSKINEVRIALNEYIEDVERDYVAVKTDENASILDNEEVHEDQELTEDEINERQATEIKEALKRIRDGEKLTNDELGNLGEMMMDQHYISEGYKPLNNNRVTSLNDNKGGFKTGIDGVYEKTNLDGSKSYVVADAKYNTSQLSETKDGKQMSDNWIDKRLDNAVGKEKADEIRDTTEDSPDLVSHEVYHIDPNIDENGNTHTDIQKVDSDGNKFGDKSIVEYFDQDGNRIEPLNKR